MPDWLFTRQTVIGFAILGGICSLLASWCQSRERIATQYAIWFSRAAYVFTATSIILFIGAGVFASET